jgi:hypothetical protein
VACGNFCTGHRRGIVERPDDEVDVIDGDQSLVIALGLCDVAVVVQDSEPDLVAEQPSAPVDCLLPERVTLPCGLPVSCKGSGQRQGDTDRNGSL